MQAGYPSKIGGRFPMAPNSLPPGFRFRPTDQELVCYYLKRKIYGQPFQANTISDIDFYKFEPWDLPGMACLRSKDLEWYFFCPRDRKYPKGSRIKRATNKGFWKTTGNDRAVSADSRTVGMKKTLVYHKGRAPHGERTDWVMHEYRLQDLELNNANLIQDSYVLCRVFHKSGAGPKNGEQYGAPFREEDWLEDSDHEAVAMTSAGTDSVIPAPQQMNILTLQETNEQGNTTPQQTSIQDNIFGAAELQSQATDDYDEIQGFLLECIADDLKFNSEEDESVQRGTGDNLKQDVVIPHESSTCTALQSEDGRICDDLEDIILCAGKEDVVQKIEDVINFHCQDNWGTEQEYKNSHDSYLSDIAQPWRAVLDGCFLELNDLVNPMEPINFAPETTIDAPGCPDDLAVPLMASSQNGDLDRDGAFLHIAPSSLCGQHISSTQVSDGSYTILDCSDDAVMGLGQNENLDGNGVLPHIAESSSCDQHISATEVSDRTCTVLYEPNGLQEAHNTDGKPYLGQTAETAGTPILAVLAAEQWMDSNVNTSTSGEAYDAENAPPSAVTQHLRAGMPHTKDSANPNTRAPSKLGIMLGSFPARPASAAELPPEIKYFTHRPSFSSMHVTNANAPVKANVKHVSRDLECSRFSGIVNDSLEKFLMSSKPGLGSIGFKSSTSVLERKKARSAQSEAIWAVVWFLILGATVALGKCISKLLI